MNVMFININQLSDKSSTNTLPLVCGYIAANLNANGHRGYIVDDVRDEPLKLSYLGRELSRIRPGIVCFSVYHYQMERVRFFARFIKQSAPEIVIVLGGPQIVFMPADALEDLDDVDIICNRGEGEAVMLEVADSLESGRGFGHIEGIAYKENGVLHDNPPPKCFVQDLDIYPSPYLNDVIDLSGKSMASLLTSRGCEHVCNFCATPFYYHKKIQFHSIERVLDEMEYLNRRGIDRFWIGDPNFTAYRERTEKLLEEKIRRGIKSPFWCQTRVDLVDEELLNLMKRAGLDIIGFGFESGSDEVLDRMHKDVTVDHFHRMVQYAQSIGINIDLFSMYGQPGETVEYARKTLDVVRHYNIPIYANSHAQQLQLYFGSMYSRNPEKFGLALDSNYRPKYLPPWFDYETDRLKKNDLARIQSLWTLYNAETQLNLKNRINIFHTVDLLLANRKNLKGEKRFYEMILNLASLVESRELMIEFAEQYVKQFSPGKDEIFSLLSNVEAYSGHDGEIGENSRVIIYCEYDQQANFNQLPVKFGLNDLRHDVPKGFLIGMKKGESRIFPLDAEKKLNLYVSVLNVYQRKKIKTVKELKSDFKAHDYSFILFDMLKSSSDELLLYLALRSMSFKKLAEMPAVFLNLVSFYSKLHKFREIEECYRYMRDNLKEKEKVAESVGDIISLAGRYAESLPYFENAGNSDAVQIKKANALTKLSQYEKAYKILSGVSDRSGLLFKELLVESLRHVRPEEKELIKKTDSEALDLRVSDELDRERNSAMQAFGGMM